GIVFAESGLLIGFFLPGDTLLFSIGFLASQGVVEMNVHLLVAILFVAAVLGDNLGYAFGNRVGRKIFTKPDSLLFNQKYLEKAEKFFAKYGPITLVLARFTPMVRTFAPIVAGVGKMQYPTFFTWNVLGGLLWTAGITYLGFYGGAFLEARGINVEALVMPIILLAVFATLISPLYHIVRDRDSRALLLKKLRLNRTPDK
ncbi:MAG TPA: VTT domain-containing protein, partial [Candidatus Saccharimonadales bacterium]|nr:VTT domain-containing protein [Candidatus Saccharimonadales bacterium]